MESKRPEWEVRTYGDQLDDIDADLMAQIVILLGRELMDKTADFHNYQSDNPPS